MPLSNKRSSVFPGFMSIQGQTIGQNLNLGPEYTAKTAAKMQNIERRQQIANVLLQQAFQPKEARQAGRFVVAPSNIEQLSGPASALASAVASYYLDKEREKTALDEMDAVKQAYSTFAADTAPIQPYRAAHEPDTAAVPGQAAVPAVPSNLDSIIGQANPQSRTAVTDALLGTQAPPPQIRALPVGPPPLSREFSSAPSALPASYDLGTAGQAAVPAVPAQLGARLSNEELLAKANIPMILNSDATGTIQDPVRAKEAVRPDEMGRDRTESEIRQAQMALVSSGVPNAWNMVAMDSQQRQADEARKELLRERRDEFQERQKLAKDAAADKKEYQLKELEYKTQAATERAENTTLSLQQRKDAQTQLDYFKQQGLDLRKQVEKDRLEREQEKRDEKQQKVTEGRDDVSYMIGKMENNVRELQGLTAIPSTENSSLGNLRASASNSGLGRAVGQVFGTTAQTVRNKNKSLIPGLLLSLKQATGSSARSFDSNKELDFYIGILGDDKSTVQAQLDALGNVKRLYGSRKESGPPGVPPPAADGRPVKISSEAEYDKLDAGTVYMKPDGLLYRKQ